MQDIRRVDRIIALGLVLLLRVPPVVAGFA